MNLDQIFNMIGRLFLRKAVRWGVNKGVDTIAGKGKPGGPQTPADKRLADNARQTAKMARKAARVTRRLGR